MHATICVRQRYAYTEWSKDRFYLKNKKQWTFLQIIVKNELTILSPEPKDVGFHEAARGVVKVKETPADR